MSTYNIQCPHLVVSRLIVENDDLSLVQMVLGMEVMNSKSLKKRIKRNEARRLVGIGKNQ